MFLLKMPQKKQNLPLIVPDKWYVDTGDDIKKGDLLCEIETFDEKIKLKSPLEGKISEISAGCGQIIPANATLAIIDDKNKAGKTEKENSAEKQTLSKKNEGNMANVIPILMPQAGQSMEEGTILAWKIKEGDTVEVGQIIFEIETDKATMEIEATDAGKVAKIVAAEGDIVEVKVPVAYIADSAADVEAYINANAQDSSAGQMATEEKTAAQPSKAQTISQPAAVSDTGRVKASPAARKIASEKGVNINAVATGSGVGGRIISADIENVQVSSGEMRTIAVSKMRKAIANNLSYSKQNIPHFYIKATIEAQKLFMLYKQVKQEKFKCSVNDFITFACAKAIKQFPAFRSQYNGSEITEFPNANIGIAVGTDDGLTVPVLVAADSMNLEQVAANTRKIVESARAGKLEGIGKGVFTITNLGMFGTEEFAAIINPPESAILSVGAIREAVVAKDGAIKASRVMTVQLSVDHRIVDGVVAAQFIKALKDMLEEPETLL